MGKVLLKDISYIIAIIIEIGLSLVLAAILLLRPKKDLVQS